MYWLLRKSSSHLSEAPHSPLYFTYLVKCSWTVQVPRRVSRERQVPTETKDLPFLGAPEGCKLRIHQVTTFAALPEKWHGLSWQTHYHFTTAPVSKGAGEVKRCVLGVSPPARCEAVLQPAWCCRPGARPQPGPREPRLCSQSSRLGHRQLRCLELFVTTCSVLLGRLYEDYWFKQLNHE